MDSRNAVFSNEIRIMSTSSSKFRREKDVICSTMPRTADRIEIPSHCLIRLVAPSTAFPLRWTDTVRRTHC
eukprot:1115850-Rhodomonas_salina.1